VLCEIGGTVGDIESLPFLEAIRQQANQLGRDRAMFIHLTLVPYLKSAGELKTKPTQHSVKELQSVGIQPDIILCRCERELPLDERRKIGLFCNVPVDSVIAAPDVSTIYEVPITYAGRDYDEPAFDAEMLELHLLRHDLEEPLLLQGTQDMGRVDHRPDEQRACNVPPVGDEPEPPAAAAQIAGPAEKHLREEDVDLREEGGAG
ncbi:MAG: hypothetical protein IH804_08625, partial [Planctomycetes bacterium]|nr:hypothetical protein [Planctomycetota bacterium]